MHKFASKYALAAHLSLLTVAPLVLLPYCSVFQTATAMLWVALVVSIWVFAAPSVLSSESVNASRKRVLKGVKRDPLFWFSLAIVAFTALRWLNSGIETIYDFNILDWKVKEASLEFLPSAVKGSGYLEFSFAVSLAVLFVGTRHSMGRKARFFYVCFTCFLAAVAALAQLVIWNLGDPLLAAKAACDLVSPSFIGTVYGVFAIASLFSIAISYENKWALLAFLSTLSAVPLTASAFLFSTPITIAFMAVAFLLSFIVLFPYVFINFHSSKIFKCVFSFAVSVVSTTLLLMSIAEGEFLLQKISFFSDWQFFSKEILTKKEVLSAASFKIWLENMWLGCGLDSFKLELPFAISNEAREFISPNQTAPLSGWWLLLAERGIIGSLVFLTVLVFLVFSLFYRFIKAVKHSLTPDGEDLKHSVSFVFYLPIIIAMFLTACTFFEVSSWRIDMLLPVCGFFVVGARSVRNAAGLTVAG